MSELIVPDDEQTIRSIKSMPPRAALAFAVSCVERQWPVWARGTQGWPLWDHLRSPLRKMIDLAWDVTKGLPDDEMPVQLLPSVEDLGDRPLDMLEVAHVIADTLRTVRNNEVELAHFPAYRNICLLESLHVSWKEANVAAETKSRVSQQIQAQLDQEVSRQNLDLAQLQSDPGVATIGAIELSSRGRSLFGTLWFPS